MMTKKDYERAASIVRMMSMDVAHKNIISYDSHAETASLGNRPASKRLSLNHARGMVIYEVREAFVALFAGDNPRFDANRFRAFCVNKSFK